MKKLSRKRVAPRTQPLAKQYRKYFVPNPAVVRSDADNPNDLRQPPALKSVPSFATTGVEVKPITQ
jgi:hypothetical protein